MIYIKKYLILFLTAIFFLIAVSCISLQSGKPTITTGVFGKVTWQEGNLMPSPDIKKMDGQPIKRVIRFYEVTNINQTTGQAPLFKNVATKLIAEVKSNKEGYFQCKLKPGIYSYFTVEAGNFLFGNDYNSNGEITRFEVKQGEVTNISIKINYKASF